MSGSLFGVIATLDPKIAVIIFICLIIALIFVESGLHIVEHQAKIAGYEELVNRLYRELALMGSIGFCVLIAFTVFPLEHGESYLAFEFSHITTFFIAIFLCLRAIFVVYNARVAAKGLWAAHNISAKTLSELHEAAMVSWNLEGILYRYVGVLSPLRRWVEYTLIEEYFYRHFCISRTEFRFVDYLTRSYQMYAVSLTEISPYSWGVIILFALINYLRIVVFGSPHHACSRYDHSSHSTEHSSVDPEHPSPTSHPSSHNYLPPPPHYWRFLSSETTDDDAIHITEECANYQMSDFAFCGGLLTVGILVIAYITWVSECKLLDMAMTRLTKDNYGKHSNYGKILKALAILDAKKSILVSQKSAALATTPTNPTDSKKTISSSTSPPIASDATLPSSTITIPSSSIRPEDILEDDFMDLLDESMVYHMVTLRLVLKDMKHEEEIEQIKREYERNELIKRIFHNVFSCQWLCQKEDLKKAKQNRLAELKEKERKLESFETKFRTTSGRQDPTMRGYSTKRIVGANERYDGLQSIKRVFSVDSDGGIGDDHDFNEHDLRRETNIVFIGSSRKLYKLMIEVSLMLFALYCSLWVSHFILIGQISSSPIFYLVIISVSIVIIFILVSYIQYHSNMILSVTSLCNENAEWMCTQDYVKSKTLPILRREIKEMLDKLGKGEFEEAMKEIFYLVNMDGDEKILLDEFSTLLYTLDIHLTSAETLVLFRSMDMDGNGSISLDELRELLLDDSVLISKKTEHANVKMVRLKSKSSIDQFQKLVAKEITVDQIHDALKRGEDDEEAKGNTHLERALCGENDLEQGENDSQSKKSSKKSNPNSYKIVPVEGEQAV